MSTVAPTPRVTTITPAISSAGPFLVGFRLFEADAVDIYVDGERLEAADFIVAATFVDGYDDNAVILLDAPVVDQEIRIEGAMRPRRESDYIPTDPSVLQKINGEFGRVWATLIELRREASRSLRVQSEGPVVTLDAGRSVMWDGTKFVPGPTGDEIINAQDYAEQAQDAADTAVSTASFTEASLAALLARPGTFPIGAIVLTRAEGYSFEAVSSAPHITTAGGAMLRVSPLNPRVTPLMFGAVGDGVADDTAAVQACWIFGAANSIPVHMEGLEYNCSAEVTTRSNLTVYCQGAVMYLTAWPATGGFIHNVVPGDPLARIQSNIRIYDLITDGSKLPPPDSTQNTNLGPGFARGASNVRVVNCTARYMRQGFGSGSGGGGFGGEQGLQNVVFEGCVVHDCYRGVRVAGLPGNHADAGGAKMNAVGVVFRDLTVRNCGAAILCHSISHPGDDQSDLGVFDALFDGLYIEDCGHAAWNEFNYASNPSIVPQKSGVLVFAGAQNVRFRGVRVKLNSDYTTRADWLGRSGYPATGTNHIGAGLSGKVGALVWGWGRNIVIEDITLDGSVDAYRRIARAVSLGEIASIPPGVEASPNEQNRVSVVHVRGGAVAYGVDGWRTAGGSGLSDSYVTEGVTILSYAAPSGGMIAPNASPSGGLSTLNGLMVEFHAFSGGWTRGAAPQWLSDPITITPGGNSYKGGIDLGGGYSPAGAKSGISYAAGQPMRSSTDNTTAAFHHAFYNPNGLVGSIQTSGAATTFSTSSDKRLKDDPQDFDGLGIVEALRVYDHAWRAGGRGFGVFAQEAADVFPDAVTMGDTDDDWNAKGMGERIPWGVDYSKIVPLLIRAVQQLSDENTLLIGRIEALEQA